MTYVICDISISVDGYITGPNDSRDNPFGDGAAMLHDWIFDAATDDDRALLQDAIDATGQGRPGRTARGSGWSSEPPPIGRSRRCWPRAPRG